MKKLIMTVVAIIVTLATTLTTASAEIYLGRMADYDLENACGIISTVNCINELGLEQVQLGDAIKMAETIGWDPSKGGMTYAQAESLAKVIAPAGVRAKSKPIDCKTICSFLSEGKTIALAIDSNTFWKGSAFQKVNHFISVLGAETDNHGNLSFVIADSGMGFERMTMDQFESCTGDYAWGIVFRLEEC